MSLVSEDIAKSLRVATQQPLDAKTFFFTLEELKNLGPESHKAYSYYEGMQVFVMENSSKYIWKEISFGDTGEINQSFAYPAGTVSNNIDYSDRYFNFVKISDSSKTGNTKLFFFEPSVNIEIREAVTPTQAMYFGKLDIGTGLVDVALIKNTFVSQSNFELLQNINVGAEIKMMNGTNNMYLGHFTISNITYNGYRVLDIIEKGDWSLIANYNIQEVYIHVVKESLYTVSLDETNFRLSKGNQILVTLPLGDLLVGGDSAIVSGTVNSQGIVTFTKADSTTFNINFSGLISADALLSKEGIKPVHGSDIYENIFVAKAMNGILEKGFYSADISTNYNSTNFPGFPYPANRDFIACRYNSRFYILVKKTIANGKRIFNNPNDVFGLSFFKYKDINKKSMQKLGYVKILSRKQNLAGLNSGYWAFSVWDNVGGDFPLATATTAFNELTLVGGVNEIDAYCMVSKIYEEKLSLKKSVTLPYTIKEEDNGLILCISASSNGNLTVPPLPYGFECGLVPFTVNEVSLVANATSIISSPGKQNILSEQYSSAYLMCNDQFTPTSSVVNSTNSTNFVLLGDLKEV